MIPASASSYPSAIDPFWEKNLKSLKSQKEGAESALCGQVCASICGICHGVILSNAVN